MRLRVLVITLVLSVPAMAQKPFTRDISLTETNAGVKVNALAQGADDYIWLATDIGVMRYNGHTFIKLMDSMHKPVTAICTMGKDVLVGYSNGSIGTVESKSIRILPMRNYTSSAITSLHAANPGLFVAGTEEQGFLVGLNNISVSVNSAKGLSDDYVYDVSVIDNDHIIVATDKGINDVRLKGSDIIIKKYNTTNGLPDNITSVIRRIPATNMYWVGTQEKGIALYDEEHKLIKTVLPASFKWTYGQVNDILPVSATRAWVATENGYILEVVMADSGIDVRPHYYPGKSFRKMLLDRTGNIWCGTNRGLTLMTGEYVEDISLGKPYTLYDATAMIYADSILSIALKKDLYMVSLTSATSGMKKVFSAKAAITSLYKDKAGRLWIGTLGDGLYYESGNNIFSKAIVGDDVPANASILHVTGTRDRIWVSGLKGVEELSFPQERKMTLIKHHGKKTGTGSDYVYQLYPDHKGNIWMATDGAGICMYDGEQYHHWDTSFEQDSKVAYSIAEDTAGDIWAATMYKDLFHFHRNSWYNLRLPETQYPDINISAVAANGTGQVLSVYQRCIDVWYPESRYFRHFNSALGIGIDSTSNVLNCVAKDDAGNVYVPYQHGIAMFRNQVRPYDIRPSVTITHPTVFSKPVAAGKHWFEYDENYVGFAFDGVGYANHERLNYRYTLQGYNDDWIYTNDAAVSFPKLSPGEYTFKVQVSLNPAFEHPNEAVYSFAIAAPFWKTNLFYFLATVIILLIVYLYVKLRERRLKSISRLQQERMVFEYEHLKSQVNPHFLFNSLYALSILIEEKRENAASYTVHLADLYRNMLTYSKKDLILLKEEFEILMNYIHIQQTRFGDALQVNTNIPEDIMNNKKIVPLAIQLLVENAIKHNVVSAALPLVISIKANADEIEVRNFIQPKLSKEKGAGIGLVNIKERYGLLTKKPVVYGVFENEFVVKLPLL